MVFIGSRLAVFVDGCFWHGCPLHSTTPKNNRDFWVQKLRRNRERDAEAAKLLTTQGWRVLRFWEHEVEASPANCALLISAMLRKPKESTA